jgi:hypothetical protein
MLLDQDARTDVSRHLHDAASEVRQYLVGPLYQAM